MLLYMDCMHPGKYKLSSVSFEMLVIGNSQRSLRRSMDDPGTCTSIFGSIVGKRNSKETDCLPLSELCCTPRLEDGRKTHT